MKYSYVPREIVAIQWKETNIKDVFSLIYQWLTRINVDINQFAISFDNEVAGYGENPMFLTIGINNRNYDVYLDDWVVIDLDGNLYIYTNKDFHKAFVNTEIGLA